MNQTTRALTEAALTGALTCIFGIAAIYVPLLSIFMFFVTIPLVVVARRQGIKYAALSLLVSSAVITMFSSPLIALYYVFLPGIPAVTIGICMYLKKPAPTILTAGFIAAMLTSVFTVWMTQQMSGIPIQESIRAMMAASIEMSDALFARLPAGNEEAVIKAKESMHAYVDIAVLTVPAVLIVWSSASSFLNYIIAGKILKRIGSPVEPLPPFKELRLPKNITTGVLLIILLTMVVVQFKIIDPEMITANVIMLVQITFSVQGLAVMFYYMAAYRFIPFLKVVIILFLLLSSFGIMALMFVGMFDVIFDFRKRLELRLKK